MSVSNKLKARIFDWKVKIGKFKDDADYKQKKGAGTECNKCNGTGVTEDPRGSPSKLHISRVCSKCDGDGFY